MRSNKIFRWIWRVDGILIFLGGLGVLTLIGIAAFSALMDKFKSHNNNTVRINTEEGAKLNLKLSYGKFTKIEGANSLVAPLISEQKYSNFGYASSKEQNNQAVRNYLFLDLTNQTTHWLLPNNDILFLGEDEIPAKKQKPENAEQLPVTAIYYRIVKADSNNDGRLDQNDKMTVAISDANGENFTELITDIEEFLSDQRIDDENLLLIYRSNGGSFAATIKIAEKKVTQNKELPKING